MERRGTAVPTSGFIGRPHVRDHDRTRRPGAKRRQRRMDGAGIPASTLAGQTGLARLGSYGRGRCHARRPGRYAAEAGRDDAHGLLRLLSQSPAWPRSTTQIAGCWANSASSHGPSMKPTERRSRTCWRPTLNWPPPKAGRRSWLATTASPRRGSTRSCTCRPTAPCRFRPGGLRCPKASQRRRICKRRRSSRGRTCKPCTPGSKSKRPT